MKLSVKNIIKSRTTIAIVLIVEMLFPFYSMFASVTVKECCHTPKVVKKHCCCEMAEENESTNSCDLNFDMQRSHSLNNCECVHKSLAASNEVTPQKNFELSKEVSVNYFVDTLNPITNVFSLQTIFSLDKYHSPPIYLVTSSILI